MVQATKGKAEDEESLVLNVTNHQKNAHQNHNEVSSHLTPVRVATIKKTRQKNRHSIGKNGEKGTLVPCWWDCKLVQQLYRTVWRSFRKLKIEL